MNVRIKLLVKFLSRGEKNSLENASYLYASTCVVLLQSVADREHRRRPRAVFRSLRRGELRVTLTSEIFAPRFVLYYVSGRYVKGRKMAYRFHWRSTPIIEPATFGMDFSNGRPSFVAIFRVTRRCH